MPLSCSANSTRPSASRVWASSAGSHTTNVTFYFFHNFFFPLQGHALKPPSLPGGSHGDGSPREVMISNQTKGAEISNRSRGGPSKLRVSESPPTPHASELLHTFTDTWSGRGGGEGGGGERTNTYIIRALILALCVTDLLTLPFAVRNTSCVLFDQESRIRASICSRQLCR